MEQQLSLGNDDAYDNALRIYQQGIHTMSAAKVALNAPLASDVMADAAILGAGANGNQVVGFVKDMAAAGATELTIMYKVSDAQKNYVECQVGASTTPNTDGGFASTGTITIDGTTDVQYSYDPLEDNMALRSIQSLSTGAATNYAGNDYSTYEKFYSYYGAHDYADQIVLAAYAGEMTALDNFNNDFKQYDYVGKEQIIKKATAYITIWMEVIVKMEEALALCGQEGATDHWDQAVAFYTGSLEGIDGAGSGKLVYALADKRCANFKTCGENGDETSGTSQVNTKIFDSFLHGQGHLTNGECDEAKADKEIIETQMHIPLIQGTLRYAWKTDNEPYSEKAEAEGTVFALAVVPAVYACDAEAGNKIAENMEVGQSGTAGFQNVKTAFESTYECLGIDGMAVGGLYDSATETYFEGAGPAGGSGSSSMSMAVGAGIAAVTSLFMFM
jgi:hypothetical protein